MATKVGMNFLRYEPIQYYDPLYETITFERGFPYSEILSGWIDKDAELDPADVLSTAEFCRLSYLRQAGLAWLIFPSATHTRFAHSIGSWWLARVAESRVKVFEDKNVGPRSLESWLRQSSLREEFYLAALLHDIGHGPFSHVLEHNPCFRQALRNAGLDKTDQIKDPITDDPLDHEHRGVYLIEGEGPLAKKWKEMKQRRYGSQCKTLADINKFLYKSKEKICLDGVYYLMTDDSTYLSRCSHSHRKSLPIIKDLVSGLVDIDRLDHAARDSYFSGVRQLVVNISGLLGNLVVEPHLSDENNAKWILTSDGARHVASLLFNRRQLFTTMFRNPHFLALSSMANRALTIYLESRLGKGDQAEKSLEIALLEDDQFLELISGPDAPEGCRVLGQQIRNARPYLLAGRWNSEQICLDKTEKTIRKELSELESASTIDGVPNIIINYDPNLWKHNSPYDDFLNADKFLLSEGGTLTSHLTAHPEFKADFEHLKNSERIGYVWAFVRKQQDVDKIREKVGKILKGNEKWHME